MSSIQKEPVAPAETYCGGAGDLPGHYMPTGPGGNRVIINQNEKAIIDASFQNIEVTSAPDMWAENDSTCQGVYRRAAVAGS